MMHVYVHKYVSVAKIKAYPLCTVRTINNMYYYYYVVYIHMYVYMDIVYIHIIMLLIMYAHTLNHHLHCKK